MIADRSRRFAEKILADADIVINGSHPWDIQVRDEALYQRVLLHGSLGLGEAYMDGWWDCASLDQFFFRVFEARLHEKVRGAVALADTVKARILNLQDRVRALRVGRHHYDMGNDFFQCMLDPQMIYSCGYWKNAASLQQAQENKLDMVCRKLRLEPGMRILDVGCGWGGTAKFAAEHFKVEVVGVTVSREQARLAQEICQGLPVEIHLQDYRTVEGSFDRIVSIGMFEHVGHKNYMIYMKKMAGLLKEKGLFLLQTIGCNHSSGMVNPWIERYIFPNGALPSPSQITEAIEGLFVLEDWHNFGQDYDRTLMSWYRNFEETWPDLKDRYDERFHRMWKYFLLSSAGDFRARRNQLWQIVLSR
ncbi:cyclopropane fatty acyl phospholipid synthase, partial [bacterium]|nr:cyclopropane fatty acyl phospholipid synthase [bacterium]